MKAKFVSKLKSNFMLASRTTFMAMMLALDNAILAFSKIITKTNFLVAFVCCLFILGAANLYSQQPIFNGADFLGMSPNGDYYLADDIVLRPNQMYPQTFSGTLDGRNHKITVNINSNLSNVGLFSQIDGGWIGSLIIDGSVVGELGSQNVGGLVGLVLSGMLYNITNLSKVTSNSSHSNVGGIAGKVEGHSGFANCNNNGIITGGTGSAIAGIVGFVEPSPPNAGSTITCCRNSGAIESHFRTSPAYMAGIIGYFDGDYTQIYGAVNIGKISSSRSDYAGGIAAFIYNGGLHMNVNAGIVEGATLSVGGIVGHYIRNSSTPYTVDGCLNVNWVTGSATNSGAIIGNNVNGIVQNCYYDNQMCVLPLGIGAGGAGIAVLGLSTDSMIGVNLQPLLANVGAFYTDNLYPMPHCNFYNDGEYHPIELIAAAPIYLPNNERVDNITTDFFVSNYDPTNVPPNMPYPYQWGWYPNGIFSPFSFMQYISVPLSAAPQYSNTATIIVPGGGQDSLSVRLTNDPIGYEKIVPIFVGP